MDVHMTRCTAILLSVIALAPIASAHDNDLDARLRQALGIAVQKYSHTVAALRDTIAYPRFTTPEGGWKTVPPSDWTSGFFPGILWYLFEWTGDTTLSAAATRYTCGLASQQFNAGTHDVGFMMYCSYGNALRLSPQPEYRQVVLQSATTLATRFRPAVGCIKSWDWSSSWQYPVIIDNMMNLELLFWAAKNGGPASLREIAIRHAETTTRDHFRDDGSTFHVVDYDTLTGAVRSKATHQGHDAGSAWARGQAWGLYGYTMAYRETRNPEFLITAQRAADYFIEHLPADHVPYWDFQAPGIPSAARDASAAAIAASGLLDLADLTPESGKKSEYAQQAEAILYALVSPAYFAKGLPPAGVLKHCTGNHPGGQEIDVSLIYGDYYLIEAMLRYIYRYH